MEHKGITSLLAIVLCIGLVAGCISLESHEKNRMKQMEAEQNAGLKNEENGDEVAIGQTLSQEILYEDEEIICYEDRILCHFFYEEATIDRIAVLVKGMLEQCPALEHIYVLPIPYLTFLEEGYIEEKEAYLRYMEQLSLKLPEKGVLVDTLPILEAHKSEYIFYKTEDAWTARGAYYGTEAICNKMGMEPIPLEQYYEYMYISLRGGLRASERLDSIEEMDDLKDYIYYYLLPGSPNRAEVIEEDSLGNKVSYKKPVVTGYVRNLGAFIGSKCLRAIVEGEPRDANNEGKYLLVVCDSAGRLLVPYLKDYYDGVYVVNIKLDGEFYLDFNQIVEEYHISDVLYVQNTMEMGVSGYSKALNDFCEE